MTAINNTHHWPHFSLKTGFVSGSKTKESKPSSELDVKVGDWLRAYQMTLVAERSEIMVNSISGLPCYGRRSIFTACPWPLV